MNRIALVTGGTRGIGAAIAKGLAKEGHTVLVNYHQNVEAAKEFTKSTGIKTYKWDVSDYEITNRMISEIEEKKGPIDILVNNAGITRDTVFRKMSPQQWQEVISTNLGSCFNMCRCLIEPMLTRGFGRIVNISSINAQRGQIGQVNYCAAKAGILGFTKALAQETIQKGITVNAITPGYTDTDMVQAVPAKVLEKIIEKIPIGYLGKPEDIARGVVFLTSDEAHYITGSTLVLTEDFTMHNFDPFKFMSQFGFESPSNPFMEMVKKQSQMMMEVWQKSLGNEPKKMENYFEDIFTQNMKKFDEYFSNQKDSGPFQEYRKAYLAYLSYFNDFFSKAYEEAFDKMNPTSTKAFSPDKASEMFHAWLQYCEKLYEAEKLTQHYQKLYTDMINAWGKWKNHSEE